VGCKLFSSSSPERKTKTLSSMNIPPSKAGLVMVESDMMELACGVVERKKE